MDVAIIPLQGQEDICTFSGGAIYWYVRQHRYTAASCVAFVRACWRANVYKCVGAGGEHRGDVEWRLWGCQRMAMRWEGVLLMHAQV